MVKQQIAHLWILVLLSILVIVNNFIIVPNSNTIEVSAQDSSQPIYDDDKVRLRYVCASENYYNLPNGSMYETQTIWMIYGQQTFWYENDAQSAHLKMNVYFENHIMGHYAGDNLTFRLGPNADVSQGGNTHENYVQSQSEFNYQFTDTALINVTLYYNVHILEVLQYQNIDKGNKANTDPTTDLILLGGVILCIGGFGYWGFNRITKPREIKDLLQQTTAAKQNQKEKLSEIKELLEQKAKTADAAPQKPKIKRR